MPAPTPFPADRIKSLPGDTPVNPASGLCDEFYHAGLFVALAVDAHGKESLAFVPHRSDGEVHRGVGRDVDYVSKLFATDANFRKSLTGYLHSVNAVYSMPATFLHPGAA